MGVRTSIGWCDSSLNLMMGCDGCELWTKNNRTCYSGVMTRNYAGRPGWPSKFEEPVLFPNRLEKALKWKDLTGTDREDKPWLNGYPRLIFLNDMGDTFTEALPVDWMLPHIPRMEESPHIFLFLTKRPKRMATFFNDVLRRVPQNFWLGTSVTRRNNLGRLEDLRTIRNAPVRFVSAEPILEDLNFIHPIWHAPPFDWLIVGGASGGDAPKTSLEWIQGAIAYNVHTETPLFIKQLGSNPYMTLGGAVEIPYDIKDRKGEDLSDYPPILRFRQMPQVKMRWSLF